MAVFDTEVGGAPVVRDDMKELEQVFKEYSPSIFHFFSNRGFEREDCRDLTQETFLKALRGIERFRGDAKLETWLLRIATNVWKNRIRRIRAAKRDAPVTSLDTGLEAWGEPAAPVPVATSAAPDPQDEVLADEKGRELRAAVGRLPKRMQRCVTLRIDQGLKYREIAVIMQVSVDTVKAQLYQARQRLKEDLQEYFDPEDFHE